MINSAYYENVVALSPETHRNLKFDTALCNFEFARSYSAVPISFTEFARAAHEYVIAFMRGSDQQFRPVVLLGVNDAENLYVNDTGLWAASYLPVFVQHYPFVIGEMTDSTGASIDEKCVALNFEKGELLIDEEGVLQPALNAELQFLHDYQQQINDTALMVKQWDELGLLVQAGERADWAALQFKDYYLIDEARLKLIADEDLPALFHSGALKLIYQHIESLDNLPRLLNRATVRAAEKQQIAARKSPPEGGFVRKPDAQKPMLRAKPNDEPSGEQDDQRKQEALKLLAEEKSRLARVHRARYAQGEAEIEVAAPVEEVASPVPVVSVVSPPNVKKWKKLLPVMGLLMVASIAGFWAMSHETHDKVPDAPRSDAAPRSVVETDAFSWGMVRIAPGSFEMGSNNGDPDEKPVQKIKMAQAFEIGKTEVTQGQWKSVMGNLPASLYFKNCGDSCPVDSVSWNDVQEFIVKLNAKSGKQYRLPTEAEWEYACRAGGKQEYCGSDNPDSVAWYGNKKAGKTPHPVANKEPNAWGLYDMSGNVWEWVDDCYQKRYSGAHSDAKASCERVLRGGSWSNDADTPRSANRYKRAANERLNNNGFRLARSL